MLTSPLLLLIVGTVIALAVGLAIGYFVRNQQAKREGKDRVDEAARLTEEARTRAREIELQARSDAIRIRDESEAEASRRRADISREDERLQRRRAEVDRRVEQIEKRDQALNKRQSALDKRTNDIEQLYADTLAELQRVSGMTQEDAKAQLLAEVERESRNDMARIIRQVEEEAQAEESGGRAS